MKKINRDIDKIVGKLLEFSDEEGNKYIEKIDKKFIVSLIEGENLRKIE